MKNPITRLSTAAAILCIGMLSFAVPAAAGEKFFPANNATWKAECATCHLAYPPQLLSSASWRKLLAGLDRHFGTDASLEPAALEEIGRFLDANAARGKRAARSDGALRITETAWFRHEHDKVPAQTWSRPDIRTASNCAACHAQAEQGDFSERNLKFRR